MRCPSHISPQGIWGTLTSFSTRIILWNMQTRSSPVRWLMVSTSLLLLSLPCLARTTHCISPDETLRHLNKDVCVMAHVYTVVHAAENTRFLDVCSPQTSDANCHFTIVSFHEDQNTIGDLSPLENKDIQIRGTVRDFEGRAEIVLNTRQQLHGGKEKFIANPRLLESFSAEHGGKAFAARNGVGGQRGVHFHHKGK